MANKFLLILLFIFASVNARMIYRRYQKEHKNYVQIVEIFETKRRPPQFIESEKALNDFLGRDAFKTDMNCTDENANGKNHSTKRPIPSPSTVRPPKSTTNSIPTTTPRDFIPTTVYMDHMVTYSPPPFPKLPEHPTRAKPTTRQPNLDNLFTIRTTKPTIKANPKENENPDYTDIFKPTNLPAGQGNSNDKRLNGHRPNNDEFIDNEDEFEESNSAEYDELPPEEDFAESDEEFDDDIINRRKRFHSI